MKKNITGIILAAGNQTRFIDDIPKALMIIENNKTITEINIETMMNFVDDIVIAVNKKNYHFFKKYKRKNVDIKIVPTGGTGIALEKILPKIKSNNCFLIWGDSYQNDLGLYQECLEKIDEDIVIPVRFEKEPYVRFEVIKNNRISSVRFSKFEGKNSDGYHDFSLFLFNTESVKKYLNQTNHIYNPNMERDFLNIINYHSEDLKIVAVPVSRADSFNSFNSYEEFVLLKQKILNQKQYNKKVAFLYVLMRDYLTPGTIADIVTQISASEDGSYSFCNTHLANYSLDILKRLE